MAKFCFALLISLIVICFPAQSDEKKEEPDENEVAVKLDIQKLKSEDKEIRKNAAIELAKIFERKIHKSFLGMCQQAVPFELDEPELSENENRSDTWGSPYREAIASLITALNDPDIDVRKAVINALDEAHPKSATFALCERLEKEPDVEVRLLVIRALAGIWDNRSVLSLVKALKDKDVQVRLDIAHYLRRFEEASSITALIEAACTDKDRSVQIKALESIVEMSWKEDNTAYLFLIQTLSDKKDAEKRALAAKGLGYLGQTECVPLLIAALDDADNSVRENAAKSLGMLKDKRAVPALIKQLGVKLIEVENSPKKSAYPLRAGQNYKKEPAGQIYLIYTDLGRAAIDALGEIGDKSAVPALLLIMKEEKEREYFFGHVLSALGKIGDSSALPALFEELEKNKNLYAAEVIGDIGDIKAIPRLIAYFKANRKESGRVSHDQSGRSSSGIINALEKLSGRYLGEYVEDWETWYLENKEKIDKGGAKFEVVRLDEYDWMFFYKKYSSVEDYLKLLNSKDKWEQLFGIRALGYSNDKRAIKPLLAALKSDLPGIRIRAALAFADLTRDFNSPEITQALIEAMKDKDFEVRSAAAHALWLSRDRSVTPHAIKLLEDKYKTVRLAAMSLLQYLRDPASVPKLIALLKSEDADERENARSALLCFTNQKIESDHAKWQEWWEANKDRILKEEAERAAKYKADSK